MKLHWTVWLLAALLAAWASWLWRFEWHNANSDLSGKGNLLYRCDRWTGAVERVAGNPF